jgi:hypothetical protein
MSCESKQVGLLHAETVKLNAKKADTNQEAVLIIT